VYSLNIQSSMMALKTRSPQSSPLPSLPSGQSLAVLSYPMVSRTYLAWVLCAISKYDDLIQCDITWKQMFQKVAI